MRREIIQSLQNTLFIIGASATGALSGGLACHLGMRLMFLEPRGENFGGALIWLACIIGGAAAASFISFVLAVKWLEKRENRRWSGAIWLSLFVGLVLGLEIGNYMFSRMHLPIRWCATGLLMASTSMGAGTLVNMTLQNKACTER